MSSSRTESNTLVERGSDETITIEVADGRLRGRVRADGTAAFLGVRYATARRFDRCVPVAPWSGAADATRHGPICPQAPGLIESSLGMDLPPMHEDCLSLSIFVPPSVVLGAGSDLPVLVWIHGGAYVNGSGSTPWYDGSALARRGEALVIGVNYRLGIFGFYRDNNLGLLDQIEALRWVRRNVAGLGGDPDNVTVFGESAGGSSVLALMASPEARGLFKKVWSMSPSIGQYRTAERGEEIAARVLDVAGVGSDDHLLGLDSDALLAVQAKILEENGRAYDYFAPTWPGAGLPDPIVDAAADCEAHLVVGTTRDENRLFGAFSPEAAQVDDERLRRHFSGLLSEEIADGAIETYRRHRPGESPAQLVMAAQTDEGFRQRAIRLAEKRVRAGRPTHMYWFTWASPAFGGAFGSCHALDIPFTFHNLDQHGVSMLTGDGDDRHAVADVLSSELLGFAATGTPSWPAYDLEGRATWRVDVSPETLLDPEPEIRRLWTEIRPDL